MPNENDNRDNRGKQGFGSMDPEEQREIASKGGKAAHEKGTAHEFTPEEARAAGRKGGQARGRNNQGGGQGSMNSNSESGSDSGSGMNEDTSGMG